MPKKLTKSKSKSLIKEVGKLLDQRSDETLLNEIILDRINKILQEAIAGQLLEDTIEDEEKPKEKSLENNIFRFNPNARTASQTKERGAFVLQKGDAQRMDDLRHN